MFLNVRRGLNIDNRLIYKVEKNYKPYKFYNMITFLQAYIEKWLQ